MTPVTSVARLPLASGKQPAESLILAFPTSLDRPHDPMPAPRSRVSLWWPAKIGIAGALCTYLALTFGPALLKQDHDAPRPGSDLADTRPEQPGSEADRPRFAQIAPASPQSRPVEEAPVAEPASAGSSTVEIAAVPAAMHVPAARDVALPPQRPFEASAEVPQRDLSVPEQAEEVQRRLTRYGYLPAAPTGVWGSMSRQALRAFKAAHDLAQDDGWDQATERALFGGNIKPADSFVGIWGADASACSAQGNRKGLLPAVIDNQGATAGETFCAFKDRVKTIEGWTFTATCTNPRERWTTKVRLETNGSKLIWASQRGTQTYTRCERKLITAEMTPTRNR
jgi:hypothetical protein